MAESMRTSGGANQRKTTAVLLIIAQLFYLFLIPLWIGFAAWVFVDAVNTDVYDPTNQTARFLAWSLFATLAFYPIVFLISGIVSWVLYARRKHHPAFWVNSIPLAHLTAWSAIFVPVYSLARPASAIMIAIWPWGMIVGIGFWPWQMTVVLIPVWMVWLFMANSIGQSLSRKPFPKGN